MNILQSALGLIALSLTITGAEADQAINQYLMSAIDLSPKPIVVGSIGSAGWADQAEIRYSGNDQQDQSLAFRFRPKFANQRALETGLRSLQLQQGDIEHAAMQADELHFRYTSLIDGIDLGRELGFIELQTRQAADALSLNRRLVQSESFDLQDLQQAETDFSHYQQRLALQQRQFSNRLELLELQTNTDFFQQWQRQVVDWKLMLLRAQQVVQATRENERLLPDQQNRFELAQQELKLARQASASWLKYVEVKLDVDAAGDQQTSVGLSFPVGRDINQLTERALEVDRSQQRLQWQRSGLLRRMQQRLAAMQNLAEQVKIDEALKGQLEGQFNRLKNGFEAKLLLKLKTEILVRKNIIDQIHIDGLRLYIDLLKDTGFLNQLPLTNWLLRTQPRI